MIHDCIKKAECGKNFGNTESEHCFKISHKLKLYKLSTFFFMMHGVSIEIWIAY